MSLQDPEGHSTEALYVYLTQGAHTITVTQKKGAWLLREIALLIFDPLPILKELPNGETPLVLERVAADCYFHNKLDRCRALLPYLPEDSLIRLYLEARFAKREGNLEEAAGKLSLWLANYRKQALPAKGFSSPVMVIQAKTSEPPLDTMFIFRLCLLIWSIVFLVMPQWRVTKSTPSSAWSLMTSMKSLAVRVARSR